MPEHRGLARPSLSVSLACGARLEPQFPCQDLALPPPHPPTPPQHPTWTSLEGWDRPSLPETEISSPPGGFSCHSCHSMHGPFETRFSKLTRHALFPTSDCRLPHLRTGSRLRARSSKVRDLPLCAWDTFKGISAWLKASLSPEVQG